MTRTRKLGAALVGAALVASLTACGSDEGDAFAEQPVKEIEKQVKADMKKATSMRIEGTLDQGEEETMLDLHADTDGNCTGTFGRGGAEAQILSVDGASYLKADQAFWEAQAGPQADQIVGLLGDKWAKMPGGQNPFADFCDLDNFLEGLVEDSDEKEKDDQKMTKGKTKDIGGAEALELVTEEDDGTTRAWVATEGEHYFLQLEREGEESGSFSFSDYDEGVDAKAPAEDDVVDFGALGG